MGDDDVHAVYLRSLNGLDIGPPRVSLEQIGIDYLWCRLSGSGRARIDTCGVVNGCPRHRVTSVDLDLGPRFRSDLGAILGPMEKAARAVDLGDLCFCVLAGPCSHRPSIREVNA